MKTPEFRSLTPVLVREYLPTRTAIDSTIVEAGCFESALG